MAEDPRLDALTALADDAISALQGLDETQRAQRPEDLERLEQVLAYTGVVLSQTDAALLTDALHQQLANRFGEIKNNPEATAANPEASSTELLTATSQLPPATGRVLDQEMREAAATFKRSASQRLNGLRSEIDAAEQSLNEAQSAFETRGAEIESSVATRSTEFETKLSEIESSANAARQRVDEISASQEQAFERESEERKATADKALNDLTSSGEERVQQVLVALEQMKRDAEGLLGAVGEATTANHFGNDAKRQFWTFVAFIALTALAACGAVAIGIWAASQPDIPAERFAGKLAVSGVLGTLAAYFARQAGHYRDREQRSKTIELELRAFGPFIEPLPGPEQIRERTIMTRRTFGSDRQEKEAEEKFGVEPITKDQSSDA